MCPESTRHKNAILSLAASLVGLLHRFAHLIRHTESVAEGIIPVAQYLLPASKDDPTSPRSFVVAVGMVPAPPVATPVSQFPYGNAVTTAITGCSL